MTQLRWYVSRSGRARRQYDDNSVSTIVSTMGTDRSGNSYSATAIPWGVLMWGTLWKPIFCWNPWSYLAFGGHTVNCTLCCHTGTEEKGQKSAVEGVGHNGTIWNTQWRKVKYRTQYCCTWRRPSENTQWRKVRHSIVEGEGGDTTEPFETHSGDKSNTVHKVHSALYYSSAEGEGGNTREPSENTHWRKVKHSSAEGEGGDTTEPSVSIAQQANPTSHFLSLPSRILKLDGEKQMQLTINTCLIFQYLCVPLWRWISRYLQKTSTFSCHIFHQLSAADWFPAVPVKVHKFTFTAFRKS